MLGLDVVALLIPILNTVQTVGTVQSSDIFAGDPYLHRMHQELGVTDVFVVPMAHPTTAQQVLFAVSHGVAFCLAVIPMLILARRLIAGVLAADPFTQANLSVLKNGHARALRFSTLTALCDALDCTPGDLITIRPIHSRH